MRHNISRYKESVVVGLATKVLDSKCKEPKNEESLNNHKQNKGEKRNHLRLHQEDIKQPTNQDKNMYTLTKTNRLLNTRRVSGTLLQEQ